jgi:hypothetical protein
MPSKTQKQVRHAKRVAARGATDLRNGKVNPRALRYALSQGVYEMQSGRPPEPPPEWRPWKRERFVLSIQAAHLFLKGKELEEIAPLVGKADATKQRISQMVGEGVKFLMDRAFVRAV